MRFIKYSIRKLTYLPLILSISLFLVSNTPVFASESCPGRWYNPVTDTNWAGLFPIKIGGVTIDAFGMSDTDTVSTGSPICACGNPIPIPGAVVSFWEPVRLIEVVRKPGCFPTFNGLEMTLPNFVQQGTNSRAEEQTTAFYHNHLIAYPIFQLLDLVPSLDTCFDSIDVTILYFTEIDAMWSNDELTSILNPEAILFANPITQAVCAADSMASTAGWPIDALFWCCGTWGSMYPFAGTVTHNFTPLQSAGLEVCRFMAKAHREGFTTTAWLTTTELAWCGPQILPIIKKSQYRIQLVYPLPTTETKLGVFSLGRSEIIWGLGKSFPMTGEDFAFLLWRKRDCCMLYEGQGL